MMLLPLSKESDVNISHLTILCMQGDDDFDFPTFSLAFVMMKIY